MAVDSPTGTVGATAKAPAPPPLDENFNVVRDADNDDYFDDEGNNDHLDGEPATAASAGPEDRQGGVALEPVKSEGGPPPKHDGEGGELSSEKNSAGGTADDDAGKWHGTSAEVGTPANVPIAKEEGEIGIIVTSRGTEADDEDISTTKKKLNTTTTEKIAEKGIPYYGFQAEVGMSASHKSGDSGVVDNSTKVDHVGTGIERDSNATGGTAEETSSNSARTPGAYAVAPGRSALLLAPSSRGEGMSTAADPEGGTSVSPPSHAAVETAAAEAYGDGGDGSGDSGRAGDVIATAVDDASAVVYAKDVTRENRNRGRLLVAGLACLLATVGIVAGVVVSARVESAATTSAATTYWKECVPPDPWEEGEGTAANTTTPPASSKRFNYMLRILVNEDMYLLPDGSRSSESPLTEPCTPANRALTWLADDDQLVLSTSFSNWERTVQRFAIAVLFFSTDGPDWADPGNWLSGEDECRWDGVTCDPEKAEGASGVITSVTLREGNNIGGRLPDEIGLLLHLTNFNTANNAVGGTIPKGMFSLHLLDEFFAPGNQLTGTLPWQLFSPDHMPSLARLNLGGNDLSGPLPENIGDSPIHIAALLGNRLNGTIPSSLVNMENIVHLMIGANQLTGTVPSDLWKLNRTIAFFDVDNNNLGGTLPELTSLQHLNCLAIGGNMFSGQLPTLPKCAGRLNIEGSTLSGLVPKDVCSFFDQYRSVGATICGDASSTCPCCQKCEDRGHRAFCRPGTEARLPGCKVGPPKDSKPPRSDSDRDGVGGGGDGMGPPPQDDARGG